MEEVSVVPKCWPSMLLDKDWENRTCKYTKDCEVHLERIHKLEVRDDDVWIVTLPKCGTTWMQEMVWLILNSFDFEKALSKDLDDRSQFLDIGWDLPAGVFDSIKKTEEHKSPRLIKTHLPLPLLPLQVWTKRPKIIYVFRNPKDVAISGYYHYRAISKDIKPKELYLEHFIEDNEHFWLHVHEFWSLRNEPNVFYTSYERMKSNLSAVIEDVCSFLSVPIDSNIMSRMLDHLSFESMKNNIQCSHSKESALLRKYRGKGDSNEESNDSSYQTPFIRKGQVGGYKDDFSTELNEKYDRWIQTNLKQFNLTLDDLLLKSK